MQVQTVRGSINSSELGFTLPHEHVFIDLNPLRMKPTSPEYDWLVEAKVSFNILGDLLHHGALCKDNLILDDFDLAVRELSGFKNYGGHTVVDLSNQGLSPKPKLLCELSNKLNLNIVAGCGYYVAASHSPKVAEQTIDELSSEITKAITVGIEDTDVKAGIIGEIGTSHPIHKDEFKTLRAAARAHKSTGVSINVHISHRGNHALGIIKLMESEGVDPSRVVISHMDEMDPPLIENYKSVAETGAFIEFDCFGEEDYTDETGALHPRDIERARRLKSLVDLGLIDNLLISQDVCYKTYTRTYGGYGYDHIQKTILPMMGRLGIDKDEIQRITVDNPARALAH